MNTYYSYFHFKTLKVIVGLMLVFMASSMYGQTLGLTLTNNPTGQVTPGTVITYRMVLTSSQPDTNVVVTGHIPTGTTLVAGSAVLVSGVAPIINGLIPTFSYNSFSSDSSTIEYRVRVNDAAQPGLITNNNTRANSSYSPQRTAIAVSNIVAPGLDNSDCVCLNDGAVNVQNGSYSTTLIVRHPIGGQTLSAGQTYTITNSSGIFTPDGAAGPGITGAAIPNGTTFFYCPGGGCAPGVGAGQYYRQVHIPNNGNFSFTVSTPSGGSLTRTQNACKAYPALPVIPMDKECIGVPTNYSSDGGVYSLQNNYANPNLPSGFSQVGTGVLTIDPNVLATGFYSLHLIKEVDGCRVASLDTFGVSKIVNSDLIDSHLDCIAGPGEYNIGFLTDSTNTSGGVFSYNGSDLNDGALMIPSPGCYTLTYTIDNGICPISVSNGNLLVTFKLSPAFNLVSATPSPVCKVGGSVLVDLDRTSFGPNPQITVQRPGFPKTVVDTTFLLQAPNVPGSFIYTICLSETNNAPGACAGVPGPIIPCSDTLCKTFIVYNDGYDCGANNLFASQCPTPFQPDLCYVFPRPNLSLICKFFSIKGPEVVTAKISADQGILDCASPANLTGSYDLSLFGISSAKITGGPKIRSLPVIGTICDIICFSIFGWRPLGFICDALGCDKSIGQFIIDLITNLVGGEGGGWLVSADTDGDGAFDHFIDGGTFPGGGTFSVPNRVQGTGFVSVRAVGSWVNNPRDLCGEISPLEINLIDLLPIGAIPIIGAMIESILSAAGCGINLVWTNAATVQVQVINAGPPTFVNCNPSGYVFAQTLDCEIPINWSVPTAIDGCTESEILYVGVTNSVDISNYAGNNPPTPVALNGPGIYQTAGPVPGSILVPGIYPVTYTAVTCNGNPTLCTFDVVVTTGDPILECPNNLTVSTDNDLCTAVVNGLAPYQGIGCASILNYSFTNPVSGNIVSTNSNTKGEHNVPDGYAFELGVTSIEYTMEVDINGDGDYDDAGETQTCIFSVTVQDNEEPVALCVDVEVKLDNTGNVTVYAEDEFGGAPFVDGGSSDNCDMDPLIEVAKSDGVYGPSISFDCSETGYNIITLRVTDDAGNSRNCTAQIHVIDFLDDIIITMDLPEICLEAINPQQLDFSNYMTITLPGGQYINHHQVASNTYLGDFEGGFGIGGFLPFPGSVSLDPGTISVDGVYTPGTGSGYVYITYFLHLPGLNPPANNNPQLEGCVTIAHAVFELYQPLDMASPECACVEENVRVVDLGVISGGLEPYTIQFTDGVLDVQGLMIANGEYTYSAANGHDINDFEEDLGELRIVYNPLSNWSFTIVDARGCELFRSGSCDNDDLTEGPMIPTLQDTIIDTKFYFCESNYAWEHPLPSDNCAVIIYNYQINNPDGTVAGPFDLEALLNYAGGAPVDSLFAASYDFELGTSVVLYYAEDAVGNFVTNQFLVTVIDDDAPYYINCPYPPVVQDAEYNQCDAYVTFSLPIAFDNCALPPSNTQIDFTGLTTGSRFPVGTTILYWEAIDDFNNRDTCQVKIIVNDYGNYPTLACPDNVVQTNDPWLCSAVVDDIAPDYDNICFDNTRITYSVYSDSGLTDRTYCGVWDASGEVYEKGVNWIQYNLAAQPLLLITEISQSGGVDQLEITNLGPATVDISCLLVERVSTNPAANEVLGPVTLLPALDPSPLAVGAVRVFDFSFNGAAGMPACYTIHYMGVVYDQVAVNGYAGCAGFTGTLSSGDVYRHCEDDSDDASDWAVATLCAPLTMGMLNPELDVMPDNGTTTSLQSIAPNMASCIFTVEVVDEEDPFCGQLEENSTTYNGGAVTGISPTMCNQGTITVPGGGDCIIGDIVLNITGTANPTNSTITLISPQGIRVAIGEIPADTLVELFAQKAGGMWILDIVPNPGQTVTVTAWSLEITCIEEFDQPDVVINNEAGLCGASFSWIHPYFLDNCFAGTISVNYTTEDAECVPTGGQLDGVSPIGWFGGYAVTEFFCVGTTTVTYTLVDEVGNTHMCSFDVTVLDVEDPVVICPADIFVNLEPGLCRAIVCYVPVFTGDNCAVVDTIYTPPFCSEFEIGIHDVSITVLDEAGNDATCTFQVHIIEYIPQDKSLKCNNLVQVSLGFDCMTEIGADDILEGNNYRCYENYDVMIHSGPSSGHPILATSPFVTGKEVGKFLMVKVTDPETGNSCWGMINVEDKQPPFIECPPSATVSCAEAGDPAFTGEPVAEDCSLVSVLPNDVYNEFGQCANPRAEIIREWKATDASGNVATCQQIIVVSGFDLTMVDYPTDITLSCEDIPFPQAVTPSISGSPSINGAPINGGLCDASQSYTDEIFDICPRSFEILRTWKVRNTCLPLGPNNPSQHIQLISILDQEGPVLFCPNLHDIKFGPTKKVGPKDCKVNVMLPWVQITDNCSAGNALKLSVYTILPDGSVLTVQNVNPQGFYVFELPVGATYTFNYVAQDGCGNFSECAITLEIEDKTPPVTICETFHIVALTDSTTLVNAISFDDGSYDDCSAVVFDARRGTMNAAGNFVNHPCNLPGDFVYSEQVPFYCCDAINATPLFIDLRIRDAYGNANNCMVEVEVVDKVRPVIWCPDDITVQCGMPFEPTMPDTFELCVQPNVSIKNAFAQVYPITLDIFGIPEDARITDLDLGLLIDHQLVNDLKITLYSPLGQKATVLNNGGCVGPLVQFGSDIAVTFNDQAYDIAWFNQTGVKVPAYFTCTNANPSIGAYNQGQMKPQGDELKIFNGMPMNSFTSKDLCFTVGSNDIDAATNRLSNFQVQQFLQQAGLINGDRFLLEYASTTGASLDDLSVGMVYLFQVINNNTVELQTITGDDIVVVPAGSNHMFCASGTWLLLVEDTKPLGGGLIREVCLSIEYALPTALKPQVTDNTEACGLTVTHQDLGTPDNCADGTFINRRWRVDDNFNNNTTCIQRVYFRDDTPLTVQFPCDITIDCEDLSDLEATGDVLHNGDCEIVGVEHSDLVLTTTDACFKILRTWTVKDWCTYQDNGNVDYSTTSVNEALNEITFSTAINALINSRKVDIGDRITLVYYSSGTTEIPGMVEGDVYSLVRVSGTTFRVDYNTTKQQTVNITGQGIGPHVFRYANSELGLPITCDVLVEWYPFVEWYTACCNPIAQRRAYENDGDGYFKFVQEIKVIDNVAPQWVDCSDKEFCSFEADCGPAQIELICLATDDCTPAAQLVYSYTIDAFNDGTVDITGTGNDASGAYPLGTHKITFKVTDQCGNWNTCTKLFTIRDCKKPTPICINGLSVDLMAMNGGGMAEIWATSLEAGDSHDNCTEYDDLIILVERYSAITPGQEVPGAGASDVLQVTCDDIPPVSPTPTVEVVVWVGDAAGNWDYCITTVWVQDNMGACGTGMNTHLITTVTNEALECIESVDVNLSGYTNMTQSGCEAVFQNLLPNNIVSLTPMKDINPLNGVSTYDLLLIQKHILGVKTLNSPYKLIAADVNKSSSVTISDIIELRKMILSPGLNFSNNTSWRFVEKDYVFATPNKPYDFPETHSLMLLNQMNTANFIGMKIGDVSGDHSPNNLVGGETRSSVGTLSFEIANKQLQKGETHTIEIRASGFEGIQGYQYTLDFDSDMMEFVNVDAQWTDLSAANFGLDRVSGGSLTTSWNNSEPVSLADGEVLYTVTFRAKADLKLSEVMTVNSRVTRAEAYDANEELLEVNFRFGGNIVAGGAFELYQNEPNPFRDVTIIGFNLPESSNAVLTVYDITGTVIKVVRGDYAKGYNTVHLSRSDIQGNGMLYYSLETATDRATKRMIMLD